VSLSDEDAAWLANWQRHARAGGDNLLLRLGRMRRIRPLAFQQLVLCDPQAARLAASAGWRDEQTPSGRSEEELAHVRETVQAALDSLAAARVPPAAPADTAAFVAEHGRAPGALSREHLQRARVEVGSPLAARRASTDAEAEADPW